MHLEMVIVNILHSQLNNVMGHYLMEYITLIFYENLLFYLYFIYLNYLQYSTLFNNRTLWDIFTFIINDL